MASSLYFYDSFYALQWAGLNMGTSTVKVMLVQNDYTFSASHEDTTDVLAAGTEVANGNGYTTGGVTLTGTAVTVNASPKYTKFDADDAQWASLTATFRYAIVYISGTVGGITNPVLACVLLDNTPADITVSGVPYTLINSTNGVFQSGLAS